MIQKMDGQTIRWENNSSRFDVGNKDKTEIFYFGIANYGLQIEGVDNFQIFKDKINSLYSMLEMFGEYNPKLALRIGVKSSILYHRNGRSFDAISQIFKNRFLVSSAEFEKCTKTKIADIGFSFDLTNKNGKAAVQTGPMKKEEAIIKIFGENEKYNSFSKESGIFFEVDFYQDDEDQITKSNPKDIAIQNIENMEQIFEGFLIHFFAKDKE